MENSHVIQLAIVMLGGGALFLIAYLAPPKIAMWGLMLSVPFQFIDSAYGSINMVLTYMIGVAFFMRGRIKYYPFLWLVTIILFVYLASFSQVFPGTYRSNALYLIMIVSNFVLFYLVYNYIRISGDYREVWKILAILNVLCILFCVIEVIAGSAGINLFGIEEFRIASNKADGGHLGGGHLSGPFKATGLTADYLAMQSIVCLYALLRLTGKKERIFWFVLLFCNLATMVATASRGGPTGLIIGLFIFAFLFRHEIGIVKISKWLVVGTFTFAIAATLIIQYSTYNILFERIETTEFDGYVPDTRQGWFGLWDEIISKPVVGHGPRMKISPDIAKSLQGYTEIPYPHSMYLFLIYTIGFLGLFAYLWYFLLFAYTFWRSGITVGKRGRCSDDFLRGLPLLGLVLIMVILATQVRMEMFRYILHDYQQYIFMLLATYLAFSHLAVKSFDNGGNNEPQVDNAVPEESLKNRRILHYKKKRA